MGRIAVSISHEAEYAVAVAFGVRTAGGRYVFPLDIDDRLDDRERKLLARFERMREIHEATQALAAEVDAAEDPAVADKRSVGFGRPRGATRRRRRTRAGARRRAAGARRRLDVAGSCPSATSAGHKGTLRPAAGASPARWTTPARRCSCAGPRAAPAPGLVTLAVPESLQPLFAAKVVEATTMALPEDDVEEVDPEPALAADAGPRARRARHRPGPAAVAGDRGAAAAAARPSPRRPAAPPAVLDAEALRTLAAVDDWWTRVDAPVRADAARRRVRAGCGRAAATRRTRTATSAPTTRPARGAATAAAAEWHQVVVLKGAKTVIAAPGRLGGGRAVREPGHGDRRHGRRPGRGRSARCSRRASRRSTPRASGVYLHGLAGEAVRERIGDAGLLAVDLPDALADRAQAPGADRGARAPGARLGFGVRDRAGDAPAPARRPRRAGREPATGR